uniref:AAA+ ATPase domain-containing protein n=1 Tax=Chromera velia CCMP2878 TaxID=1169474 RepID=A0A0G4IAP8_9ALVE|eukprot:Cvel_12623.t1-p1 / transcript=Cvel_12623.t1 / gene=Cvel_12623 / organism=Chromera_velia_CCMP2878 / gene_product=Fidgetin-like protein 1, putative / transcript_product=Fidgetin-like protein 1, putative / location=Cvel_scaffold833:14254-20820(+) / protein_length=605 / sequence_SO=supercontig / SO=protein_coding / is_pseudo=false
MESLGTEGEEEVSKIAVTYQALWDHFEEEESLVSRGGGHKGRFLEAAATLSDLCWRLRRSGCTTEMGERGGAGSGVEQLSSDFNHVIQQVERRAAKGGGEEMKRERRARGGDKQEVSWCVSRAAARRAVLEAERCVPREEMGEEKAQRRAACPLLFRSSSQAVPQTEKDRDRERGGWGAEREASFSSAYGGASRYPPGAAASGPMEYGGGGVGIRGERETDRETKGDELLGFRSAADMLGIRRQRLEEETEEKGGGGKGGLVDKTMRKIVSGGGGGKKGGKENGEKDGDGVTLLEELGLEDENLEEHHAQAVKNMILCRSANPIREEDIAGLEETRQIVRESIIEPVQRPDLFTGLLRPPRGILLYGPPGCGKTTVAKWVASEAQATFFEVTPSSLTNKFFGESEKLVKALWKVATALAPSVVFIDEIDGVVSQRGAKEEETTIRMKNELLQMMDGVSSDPGRTVLIIGATNRPFLLDEAARRRLTKRVLVPLPDKEARREQIRKLVSKDDGGLSGLQEGDLEVMAEKTEGFNGSDIASLCSTATRKVFRELKDEYGGPHKIPVGVKRRAIRVDDLLSAAAQTHPSVSKESLADFERFENEFGAS